MQTAKRIVIILLCLTVLSALIYIVSGLVSYSAVLTSSPWWSVLVFAAIDFSPLILVEVIVLCILHFRQKKKQA